MIRRMLVCALTIALTCSMSGAMAKEPTNLALVKQKLIAYHDTGAYDKDIDHVMRNAMQYLKKRVAQNKTNPKKLAIVLDIDETSLSNYSDMRKIDFGGTYEEIRDAEDQGKDPAILPTLALYQYAKSNNVAVFFVTGRHEEEREVTAKNLKDAGYREWDGLVLRYGEFAKVPAAVYKTAIRKKIESEGYDIVLNIGDQKSDLAGGYADRSLKLPNPYYIIP
jgi:predicted secreted acid phosphatase